jgi:hypothetical protein
MLEGCMNSRPAISLSQGYTKDAWILASFALLFIIQYEFGSQSFALFFAFGFVSTDLILCISASLYS